MNQTKNDSAKQLCFYYRTPFNDCFPKKILELQKQFIQRDEPFYVVVHKEKLELRDEGSKRWFKFDYWAEVSNQPLPTEERTWKDVNWT